MKKYIFIPSGRELNIGDVLIKYSPTARVIIVTENTLPGLIKEGLVKEVSNITVQDAVKHLAERIGWNINNLDKYLDNLYKISPIAVFSIILREVAIILDERYPDHINKSKEIWTISALNGEIVQVKDLSRVKNFRNFAAFRSLDDAKIAKDIMKEALKDLYGRK